MKRTISHEASAAAARLRELGILPSGVFGAGGAPDPLTVLGLGPQARWPEVRQAYVSRLRMYHPEQQPQEFMRVVDAYDTLKRFFRASLPGAGTASAEAGEGCADGPLKRRRMDAAGASLSLSGASATTFAGLQECWPAVANAGPVIALDPAGVGHIGRRETSTQGGPFSAFGHTNLAYPNATGSSASFGHGFGNGPPPSISAFDDDDGAGLTRASSNHMGIIGSSGGGFGGMMGAPLNLRAGGQAMSCGVGHSNFSGDQDGSAMMIG